MSSAAQSTTAQPPNFQALYRACMKEAAAQGRFLMQRLLVRAGQSMMRRSVIAPDEHERKLLAEAARTLMKHEVTLCEAYPQALLGEFAHAIAGDTRKAGTLSFDSLELMGDEQMRESVELMRMQQAIASEVEAELTELNALVSAVQGLKNVQPERNPLRAEVYVRSLRTVTLQSPISAPMRARWMLHLGEALGPELARVYRELSGWMRAQGVVEARYQAVPAVEFPAASDASSEAPAGSQSSTLLNLKELRRLLSGEFDVAARGAPVREAPLTAFSMTMPAAVNALENMKQVDRVVERLRASQPAAGAADEREQARAAALALSREVVNLMVDRIANDPRLLAPVQQCVRDLQPALMRLAQEDPRFFSDRDHPARRLLDQLTQRSLAWQSVGAPGFAEFLEPLRQAVDVLGTTHVTGSAPFEFALKTLEEAWSEAQQRDRHQREKAVRALLQAEQRNLLAEKIAREMRNRPDMHDAPREIAAFITGPWSQVMAQARLANTTGSPDPGGYTSAVTDLIWSAQPRVAGTQASRLLRLVPVLVGKIRQGLASIDYPARATQHFLDHLADVHRLALDNTETVVPKALSTSMSRQELEAMMGEGDGAPGAWLAPTEAQHSGFMETHASIAPKPLFQQTQPQIGFTPTQPLEDDDATDLPVADLQPGSWVEIMTGEAWTRHQVTWASPHGTLFMFTGATGQPQSMTRHLLGKMLRAGTLRLLTAHGVVDGALDAVAHTALRNSLGPR